MSSTTTLEDLPTPDGESALTGQSAESAASPRRYGRIAGADGLRAVAALGVVFHHLFQRLDLYAQPQWLQEVQVVMIKGAYGVSIFFVLSGMLLSYPFWMAYLSDQPYPRIGHYVKRRFARIAPGFYASLTVSFVVSLAIFPDAPAQVWRFISGLTFTSGFYWLTWFPVEANGPLWSISLEVVSYTLMPLVMLGLFAIGKRRTRAKRRIGIAYWLLTFGVVIAINQWIITTFTTSDEGKGWEFGETGGAKVWMPDYNPIGFFGHFIVGILAAAVIAMWRHRGGTARWWWDLAAVAGLVGGAALVWFTRWPAEPDHTTNFQNAPYLFPAFAVCMALALVGLAGSKVLGRIVDNRAARFTAKISFGIYIWHLLLVRLVSYLTDGQFEYFGVQNPVKHLWLSIAVLLMTYCVALASWHWIERPVLFSKWATSTRESRKAAVATQR